MKKAKVAELKNGLSRYLAHVKRGGTVLVFERDRPVARIVPLTSERSSDGRLADLVRRAAPDVLAAARRELLAAWEQWSEIAAIDLVRPRAERLVERHPLRAADALQIGAALVAADDDPATLEFVTLDRVLARAAEV